ncbi:MAG: alcohol dehydrogenase catalytic domain-containing protein [Gaiellaceae bacterium]
MKAALLYEGGEVRVEETADPFPDGWALVESRAAGVCGTELHFVDGMIPPPGYPFQLGHESAGVVLEAPEGSLVGPGDRVAVYNFVGCGRCRPCVTGRESLCTNPVGQLGFSLPGGFADVVRAPAGNLVPLPGSVSFEAAAILSCSGMSVVHACRLAQVGLGDVVVVNGIGGVGLMAVQVAVAAGARVLAVADAQEKGDLARELGAAEAIVLEGGRGYETLPDRVRDLTGGAGATHYVELVGTAETYLAGIRSLGRAGRLVIIGYTDQHLDVHPIELILSELQVVTSVAASRRDLETAIELAADGRLQVTIDTRYRLEELGTAIDRLRARQVRGRNVVVW